MRIAGPVWKSGCPYAPREYVGTFRYYPDAMREPIDHDVYVYDSPLGQEVYIRFAEESDRCHWPGPLWKLFKNLHETEVYELTAELLIETGSIEWTREEES